MIKKIKIIFEWVKLLWKIDYNHYNFKKSLPIIIKALSDLNIDKRIEATDEDMQHIVHRWKVCLKKLEQLPTVHDNYKQMKLLASATEAIRKSGLDW